jgi:mannose-6-phosphate isomerase-like protein (cupin superfamily)
MDFSTTRDFRAARAWGAMDLGAVDGVTVRAHWTDQPYHWHQNDGPEVFGVLQGAVDMHWRDGDGQEQVRRLEVGDFCHAGEGDQHRAVPLGAAVVLVVERRGSE